MATRAPGRFETSHGSILWSGGSVLPVDGVKVEGGTLTVTRLSKGKNSKTNTDEQIVETITGKVTGDDLNLTTVKARPDGKEFGRAEFAGKRIPPVPAAPDLSKVKFGEPITLYV